jgi:hypothetical protein
MGVTSLLAIILKHVTQMLELLELNSPASHLSQLTFRNSEAIAHKHYLSRGGTLQGVIARLQHKGLICTSE